MLLVSWYSMNMYMYILLSFDSGIPCVHSAATIYYCSAKPGEFILQLGGLPFDSNPKTVSEFLYPTKINQSEVKIMKHPDGRCSGQGFVKVSFIIYKQYRLSMFAIEYRVCELPGAIICIKLYIEQPMIRNCYCKENAINPIQCKSLKSNSSFVTKPTEASR